MSLAETIAKVLRAELKCHIAWPPIGTALSLGDFGQVEDNIFHKTGNLADLPIPFRSEAGASLRLNFTSSDATVGYFTAEGEAAPSLPEAAVKASIRVTFSAENAVLLKAAKIDVVSIANIAQVAKALKQQPQWKRSTAVVGALLHAEGPVLLGTRSAGTEVTFSGDVGALKALDLGKLAAGLSFAKTKELGLEIVGDSGVLGVRLFSLRFFSDDPRFLRTQNSDAVDDTAVEQDFAWHIPWDGDR